MNIYDVVDDYITDVIWGGESEQVDLYDEGEELHHEGPYYWGSQKVLYMYEISKDELEEHYEDEEFDDDFNEQGVIYVVQIADMIESNEIEGIYETYEEAFKAMNDYRTWFRANYEIEKREDETEKDSE